MYKFIDLCAGIGGFRIGFCNEDFECVFSSEIDKYCRETYYNNYGELPHGNLTQINPLNIPDFDVLCAGFPCQPFSICGKKKGFEDTRGTLFFDICRIIKEKQPKVVVLENVKNLLHHDNGNTFKIIIESLENLGYIVQHKILNAKNFGVPQNRERIIIIGSKKQFNFDFPKKPIPKLLSILENNENYLNESEYTLISNPKMQPSGLMFVGYRNKTLRKRGVKPNTEHLSRAHKQCNRIYSVDGIHPTITSQETSGRYFIQLQDGKVRKLTLNECYRCMGFPTDFKICSIKTEAYKQIGNSVCVSMIQEIAKQIKQQKLL